MRFKLLCVVFSVLFMYGCSSDESDQMEEMKEYYVKYEVHMPLANRFTSKTITFISEDGEKNVSTLSSDWEGIYGPLKKNTKLYLQSVANGPVRADVDSYVRLSVSREKEAFVLKGEERGKGESTLSTSYTIDF